MTDEETKLMAQCVCKRYEQTMIIRNGSIYISVHKFTSSVMLLVSQ